MVHAATTPFDVLQWVFAVALVIAWFTAMSDRDD